MPIKKLCSSFFFSIAIFLSISFSASAQDYKIENNEVVISEPITFKTASAVLTTESEAALKIIKQYLEDKSYISSLRIECHSDNSADASDNQKLTEKRALAVCNALVAMGVDCKRLVPVGFGGTKPIADNNTPEGKAANRRVTLVNAALRGHAIGGMPVDGGGVIAGDLCK